MEHEKHYSVAQSRSEPFFSFLCSVFFFGLFGRGLVEDWGDFFDRALLQIEEHCDPDPDRLRDTVKTNVINTRV